MLSVSRGRSPGTLPTATVARLPSYLDALAECDRQGVATVSSTGLATMAGVSPTLVRKDLSLLGSYGTRGVGYEVARLRTIVADILGCDRIWPVVLVGCGRLGTALAHYGGFDRRGFRIAGLIDADESLVGQSVTVAGRPLVIRPPAAIRTVLGETGAQVGIIATPAPAAQAACDALIAAGATGVLNFAATDLRVPPHITVRRIDMAAELQILAFHQWHHGAAVERSA